MCDEALQNFGLSARSCNGLSGIFVIWVITMRCSLAAMVAVGDVPQPNGISSPCATVQSRWPLYDDFRARSGAVSTHTRRSFRTKLARAIFASLVWFSAFTPTGHAIEDYVAPEITFYVGTNYSSGCKPLTESGQPLNSSDQPCGFAVGSAKVKGVWDILYTNNNLAKTCTIKTGNYPNLANITCIGSGSANLSGKVLSATNRRDLYHWEMERVREAALLKRIEVLERDLSDVKASTAASVVELAGRINALPVEFAVDESAHGLLKKRLIEDLREVFVSIDEPM